MSVLLYFLLITIFTCHSFNFCAQSPEIYRCSLIFFVHLIFGRQDLLHVYMYIRTHVYKFIAHLSYLSKVVYEAEEGDLANLTNSA